MHDKKMENPDEFVNTGTVEDLAREIYEGPELVERNDCTCVCRFCFASAEHLAHHRRIGDPLGTHNDVLQKPGRIDIGTLGWTAW